jgi:hypothetical protein
MKSIIMEAGTTSAFLQGHRCSSEEVEEELQDVDVGIDVDTMNAA